MILNPALSLCQENPKENPQYKIETKDTEEENTPKDKSFFLKMLNELKNKLKDEMPTYADLLFSNSFGKGICKRSSCLALNEESLWMHLFEDTEMLSRETQEDLNSIFIYPVFWEDSDDVSFIFNAVGEQREVLFFGTFENARKSLKSKVIPGQSVSIQTNCDCNENVSIEFYLDINSERSPCVCAKLIKTEFLHLDLGKYLEEELYECSEIYEHLSKTERKEMLELSIEIGKIMEYISNGNTEELEKLLDEIKPKTDKDYNNYY
jgi:hypothetical protein